jgi:site-specific DNA recombinase
MQLDGYVRVSRVGGREGNSFISPQVQREAIKRLARTHKLELGEIVEELDVSGGKKIDDRELGRLVRKVEERKSSGIIVWRFSRFSRSQADAVQVASRIMDAGGGLLAEDFDSAGPMAKTMLGFLSGFAEDQLDQRRAGWDSAQRNAVANRIHIASRVPTGYRRGKDRTLEPDPRAGAIIRELFRLRAGGAGYTELARFLDSRGVVGPYSNNAWTPSAVSKILHNRVYLGEARSGKHVNPDAHEPLISGAEWEAAQARNGRPGSSARNGDGLLLAGILRCGGCRYVVKPDHMRDRDGGKIGLYRCRARHAADKCPTPASVLARLIDPYIEEQFLAAIGPRGPLAQAAADTEAVEQALQVLERAEADYAAFQTAAGLASVPPEELAAGFETHAGRVADARRSFEDAKGRSADVLPDTPGSLIEAWPILSIAEKRQILSAAIDAVMLRPVRGSGRKVSVQERVLILWRGEAPDDLPRRGRRVPLKSFDFPAP